MTGYTTLLVKRALWGTAAPDGAFLAELLAALERPWTGKAARARERDRAAFGESTDQGTHQAAAMPTVEPHGRSPRGIQAPDGEHQPEPRSSVPMPLNPEARSSVPMPLNPEAAQSVAEFLRFMRMLLVWRIMTLRDLEARAKTLHAAGRSAAWLPKSTMSDLFRKGKLPSNPIMEAFVAVCELPPDEQERWLKVRDRLSLGPGVSGRRRSHKTAEES